MGVKEIRGGPSFPCETGKALGAPPALALASPLTGRTRRPGPSPEGGRTVRWLLAYMRPASGALFAVLLLSMAAVAAGLAQPWLTMRLVDDGLVAGRFDVVLETAAMMVALAVVALLLGGATRLLFALTSARILHALRESMVAHLLTLSPSFFARTRQGDLMVRLDGDIAEVQRFALDLLLSATNSVLLLVGAFVVLYQLSPLLTAIMAALLVVNALCIGLLRPRVERLTRRVRERGADLAAYFLETLGASKSIQSFNAAARETARLHDLHGRLREDTLRLQFVGYAAGSLPGFALALGTIGVFVVGSWSMLGGGAMTIGTLIAFATYLQRASGPVQSLLGLFVAWQRVRVSLERIGELTAAAPAVRSPANPLELPPDGCGRIEIEGVRFAYPGDERAVLDAATLTIPAGSRVLLRGRSGVGKSTLADLLQRHEDPQQGSIRLDGIDLRALDLRELRRAVVVVGQDPVLFSTTLAENIRYGRPEAGDDEVREAMRRARVDEFAAGLPGGLDASIGQKGASLSGGQRQRVALARALLMQPRVLVIDEGTSAVDATMDSEIQAAIDQLFAGRTRIVISHRPLAESDFDLVVDLLGDSGAATGAGALRVASPRADAESVPPPPVASPRAESSAPGSLPRAGDGS